MEYQFEFDLKQHVIAMDYGHVDGGERKPHFATVCRRWLEEDPSWMEHEGRKGLVERYTVIIRLEKDGAYVGTQQCDFLREDLTAA